MDLRKPCFLVGIGGSGMMPLAMILAGRGTRVAGSDRTLDQGRGSAKFDELAASGIALHPQDGSGVTSPDQLVIASAAVEESVPDIAAANRLGCARATRPQVLSALFNASVLPIGVAGTSGKSTVTGMIGWILNAAGVDPTVVNGAVMKNFAHPQAPFASALVGGGDAFVCEVDESDGSIDFYRPRIAVLNNVGLDHKDLSELRQLFGGFIARAETAIVNVDNGEAAALAAQLPRTKVASVGIANDADFRAVDVKEERFGIRFGLVVAGNDALAVRLQVPGRHNVHNALAAIAAAVATGVPLATAVLAIEGFTGLKRRLEFVGEAGSVAVLDDFAHNPDKIAATLAALHAFRGRLLILFQPQGFGPLKHMRRELTQTFATALREGDRLVISDPAFFGGTVTREVTSADIAADVAAAGADALHVADREAAAAMLVGDSHAGDRIIVMGARDDSLGDLARSIVAMLRERR